MASATNRAHRVLIKNGHLISQDPDVGDPERADILIEGNVIAQIAPSIVEAVDETIDASEMFVIPGLIDTHIHLWQTAVRGAGASVIGDEYQANVKRLRDNYNAEAKYIANLIGGLEAVSGGTTTIIDHCHDVPSAEEGLATLRGTREAGIRAVYAPTINPRRRGFVSNHDERLQLTLDMKDAVGADPLVTPGMALTDKHFIRAAGGKWEWLREEAAFARANGLFMTVHSTASDHVLKLAEFDCLGPDLVPSHCRTYSPFEYGLLREHGTSVNITPVIDFRGGASWHIYAAVQHGINVSYGIDSVVFGGGQLLTQLHVAAEVQRSLEMSRERFEGRVGERRPGIPCVPPSTVLYQATMGGAIALGMESKIGSITVGKLADLVLIRKNPWGPTHTSPASYVVCDTDSGAVDTVLIDGKVRKRGGTLVDVDMYQLADLAGRANKQIFGTPIYGARRKWWAPAEEARLWDDAVDDMEPIEDVGEAEHEQRDEVRSASSLASKAASS